MIKKTIEATTAERTAAYKVAEEAGDAQGMEDNKPWSQEVDLPETLDEAVEMLSADEALNLLVQKYVVKLQQEMRNLHAPKSESARQKAVVNRILKEKGISLEELAAQLGI